jgi:methyltransferase
MSHDQLSSGILLLLATLQRVIELVISRRNTRALLAEGAYEVGRGHYPVIVFLHSAWLVALWAMVAFDRTDFQALPAIAYLAVQSLRIWTLASLGRYWTTRVIEAPRSPLVRSGPYRFLRHPNYVVVVLEMGLLPLALGSWPLALGFSIANAIVLAWRIRVEDMALATRR